MSRGGAPGHRLSHLHQRGGQVHVIGKEVPFRVVRGGVVKEPGVAEAVDLGHLPIGVRRMGRIGEDVELAEEPLGEEGSSTSELSHGEDSEPQRRVESVEEEAGLSVPPGQLANAFEHALAQHVVQWALVPVCGLRLQLVHERLDAALGGRVPVAEKDYSHVEGRLAPRGILQTQVHGGGLRLVQREEIQGLELLPPKRLPGSPRGGVLGVVARHKDIRAGVLREVREGVAEPGHIDVRRENVETRPEKR